MAPEIITSLKQIRIMKTSTYLGISRGSKTWRNLGRSVWGLNVTLLRNKSLFAEKLVFHSKDHRLFDPPSDHIDK